MSAGNVVRPQHYSTFHAALCQVTRETEWALGTGYGSLANGLTISNAETGLYLYGTVAESVQMRNVNRGATAGASLFDRVSVYGASVGFYSMTDSSRSSVRNAVFLGATPFVGALSLGGNLCNGAAC